MLATLLVLTAMLGVGPHYASAQTTNAQLQAQITQLQAQLAAIGSGGTAGICPFIWTRNLTVGSTGVDVQRLQQFLNTSADTRLAIAGPGAPSQETMYFGPLTSAAVAKFQSKYHSEILLPVGLVNPTGFFGPSTRAKINALCVTVTPPVTPPAEDPDEDEDDNDDVTLRGEGTLERFLINDASDNSIEEGDNDAPIAELELEAENGDIEIMRMDIALVGVNTPTEADPWDVFEDVSVWADGKLIARMDADNRDDYLDDDDGTLRFNRLDLVLREDREVDIVVAASIQSRVDGAGTDADWTVSVEEVRYFDGDGVAIDEDNVDELGEVAEFEIVEEGEGEKLNFGLADGNPDARDIVVDENRTTTNEEVLVYTIEAEDNDIELDKLFVNVITSATSSEVINDIELIIDGQRFRDENRVTNSPTNVTYEFDIDREVTVDRDEEIEVTVVVDLKSQDGRYPNGTTIQAQVTSVERDATQAEGADDIADFSGTAIGDTHTLVVDGAVTSGSSFSSSFETLGTNNTSGVFTLEFDVTAIEDDFYITEGTSGSAASATTGIAYRLDTPAGYVAASSSVSAALSSTADEDSNGVFTVRDGETETFTLIVTVDPNIAGFYRVALTEINYSADASGVVSTTAYVPTPSQNFRSNYGFINN